MSNIHYQGLEGIIECILDSNSNIETDYDKDNLKITFNIPIENSKDIISNFVATTSQNNKLYILENLLQELIKVSIYSE